MSFEIFLVSDTAARQLATPDDIERVFHGHVLPIEPNFASPGNGTTVRLGAVESPGDSCFLDLSVDDQSRIDSMSLNRPSASEWLWEGVLKLLQEFDYLLVWPDANAALAGRPGVPVPSSWPFGPTKIVSSTQEITDAVVGAPEDQPMGDQSPR